MCIMEIKFRFKGFDKIATISDIIFDEKFNVEEFQRLIDYNILSDEYYEIIVKNNRGLEFMLNDENGFLYNTKLKDLGNAIQKYYIDSHMFMLNDEQVILLNQTESVEDYADDSIIIHELDEGRGMFFDIIEKELKDVHERYHSMIIHMIYNTNMMTDKEVFEEFGYKYEEGSSYYLEKI